MKFSDVKFMTAKEKKTVARHWIVPKLGGKLIEKRTETLKTLADQLGYDLVKKESGE